MTGRGAGPRRRRGPVWRVGAVVICLAAGFLLGTARSVSQGSDIRGRAADMSTLIHHAEGRVAEAEQRAERLQDAIDAAAAKDVSPQVARVRERVEAERPTAQLTPLAGPALRVSLTDAPRGANGQFPVDASPDDLVVHQQDVQAVVNALWAGGAEAMTIMDQRVLSTSAVRCIGNTLLLQGRTYSPPFVVTAIGDPDQLAEALRQEPGVAVFLHYVDRYGLGFEVQRLDDVTLPGYDGPIGLTVARQGVR